MQDSDLMKLESQSYYKLSTHLKPKTLISHDYKNTINLYNKKLMNEEWSGKRLLFTI